MVRSASALAVLTSLLLAGCATTQQEAARLQLNSARIRVSQTVTRVTRAYPGVRVARVTVLDGRKGSAVVVRLRNLTGHTLTDLPISIGTVGSRGRRRYLNGQLNAPYFGSHVPAIPSGGELSWVFTTRRVQLTPAARIFALVGGPEPFSHATTLPAIEVQPISSAARQGTVALALHNLTAVPQYQLQVYATVGHGNRLLAAGRATVAHLASNGSATVRLKLFGRTTRATATLQAPATIFG